LIWVDAHQGGGWTWPEVYRFMAAVMAGVAVVSATLLPRLPQAVRPTSVARNDLLGFAAVVVAVVVGYLVSNAVAPGLAKALLAPLLQLSSMPAPLQARWIDLFALLLGIAFTLPLAAWAARAAKFETLLGGLRSYF